MKLISKDTFSIVVIKCLKKPIELFTEKN